MSQWSLRGRDLERPGKGLVSQGAQYYHVLDKADGTEKAQEAIALAAEVNEKAFL